MRFAGRILLSPSSSRRLSGTVVAWHPFERRGTIRCDSDNCEYSIPNARAFETILPTQLGDIVGQRVEFEALRSAGDVDRVITRNRLEPITARSYDRRSPVDFLASFRLDTPVTSASPVTSNPVTSNPVTSNPVTRVAGHITLDAGALVPRSPTIAQPSARQDAAPAEPRTLLSARETGVVRAWSALRRCGVVVASASDGGSAAGEFCVIRGVEAFHTALPTEQDLVGRTVTFVKVAYAAHPGKVFAEGITVEGPLCLDAGREAAAAEKAKAAAEGERARRARQLGTQYEDDDGDNGGEEAGAALYNKVEPPGPAGEICGVLTRWSGGQGVIETGSRRLYFVQSGADFVQLVDQTSSALRGAVVSFRVDAENGRNAREVKILSTATRDFAAAATPVPPREEMKKAEEMVHTELEDAPWQQGMLVTWSPAEGQGVIHGDDGERYLLRDGEEHVPNYKANKALLKKGRRVKFTPFGGTGRLARNVVALDAEADAAALAEEELRPREPKLSVDGHTDEAIASPMSTSYWISRMDRAGYDTAEVKHMQNKAITFDDDDDDDDKLLDSEDLFKKDHWFNDPRKNIKLPNSDVTAGNLALIGPASMMNIAMKVHDPKKLEKVKNKYYNRLTEPMKEYAWKQAKELAPKYEKRIKEARERGDEPRFSFY